jgi:GNAT superfamily N-acetyltransferase
MGEAVVVIRIARAEDAGRVGILRRAWCIELDGGGPSDEGFDDAFARWFAVELQHRQFFLAERGTEPVGMLNLAVFERMPRPGRPPSRWCYLGNAFVLSEHRGSGIGRALLDAAVGWADDSGAVRIVLAPSERSVPFYRRAGFADPLPDALFVRSGGRRAGGGTGRAGSTARTSRP